MNKQWNLVARLEDLMSQPPKPGPIDTNAIFERMIQELQKK